MKSKLLILILFMISPVVAADFSIDSSVFNITMQDGSIVQNSFNVFKNINQSVDFDSQIIGLPFNSSVVITASNLTNQTYQFSASVPLYFQPGTYFGKIKLQSNDTISYVNVFITVPYRSNMTITNSNMTSNLASGSSGYINIPISNNGNSIMSVNSTAMIQYITPLLNFQINPGQTSNYPLYYQIPLNFSGVINGSVLFSSGQNISLTINVSDQTPPVIIYTTENQVKATKPFLVSAVVIDNINVSYVTANGIQLQQSGNVWSGYINISDIGSSNVTFIASDGFNLATKSEQMTSGLLGGFYFIDTKMPQVQVNNPGSQHFLNITENFPFTIQILNANYRAINSTNTTNAAGYRISIIQPDGQEKDITSNQQNFSGRGIYDFQTLNTQQGDYVYIVRILIPSYVSTNNVIDQQVTQKVAQYSLIAPEEGNVLTGTTTSHVKCYQVDGGNLDGTRTQCDNFTYPANTHLKNINVLTSQSDIDAENQLHAIEMQKLNDKITFRNDMIMSILAIILVGGASTFLYVRKDHFLMLMK